MVHNEEFKVTRNWDNDGSLQWENDKTIGLYTELRHEQSTKEYKGMFFAFSDKQFEQGYERIKPLLKTMPDGSLEKIVSFGAGGFCTHDCYDEWQNDIKQMDERIKNECDPQEVYCYEFNNHEGCINWDGDLDAVKLVACYFGEDVARKLKRYNAMYSFDEIFKKKEAA